MFKNYFKTAWRSLWKNKSTTAINITGLAVAMTAAVLIFLWVQNEMNYDTYHKDSDRIYRLTTNLPANNWISETTPLLLADAVKDVPEVETTVRLYDGKWPMAAGLSLPHKSYLVDVRTGRRNCNRHRSAHSKLPGYKGRYC